jgi:hypothetical protein
MSVKGWDGGEAWVSTDMMMERFNFATRITQEKFDTMQGYITPSALIANNGLKTSEETVNYFLNLLVDNDVPDKARQELANYISTDNSGKPENFLADDRETDAKLRGLVHFWVAEWACCWAPRSSSRLLLELPLLNLVNQAAPKFW